MDDQSPGMLEQAHTGSVAASHCTVLGILGSRLGAAAAVVSAAFGLIAAFTPGIDTFGYEFTLAAGVLSAFAGGAFALACERTSKLCGRGSSARVTRRFMAIAGAEGVLLMIPAVLLVANAWRVPNCSPLVGAALFVLIPLYTVPFTTSLAMLLARLLHGAWAWIALFAVLTALLLHAVLTVFVNPQLFVYNHLFGVFTGFSWDEAQPQLATLVLFRLTTLGYAALMLLASILLHRRSAVRSQFAMLVAAVPALAIVLAGLLVGDALGFTTTHRKLRNALRAEYRTEHVTIVYSPASFDSTEIRRVGEEHEFRLSQVCAELQVLLPSHVTSYIYPDAQSKRRLLGTETSEISRPWSAEIHLDAQSWESALKHELVHVAAAAFGPYIVRTPVLRSYGLTEGLAMAVEWNYGNRTLHEYASAMLAYGMLPHAGELMSTRGFLSHASSLGYVASGSFCRWLIDTRGIAVMRRAYAADDLVAAGATASSLDREWRAFLRTVPRSMPDSLSTAYAFKRASIFRKMCPRALTEINRTAAEAARSGRWGDALGLYLRSDALAPNAAAVFGAADAALAMGAYVTVLRVCDRVLSDPLRAYTVLPILLWKGDAAAMLGLTERADSSYSQLILQNLPGWSTAAATRRRDVLRSVSAMGAYFAALRAEHEAPGASRSRDSLVLSLFAEAFRRDSTCGSLRYEYASRRRRRDRGEAIRILLGPSDGTCRYERSLLAGDLLLRDRNFSAADSAYMEGMSSARSAQERNAVADRRTRVAWLSARQVKASISRN